MFGIDVSEQVVKFDNFEASQLLDALKFGGTMLLIGMVTIFSVLGLLWLFLTLFKVAFHDIPAKKKAKPAPVVEAVTPVLEVKKDNNDEIIAAIAAAIAMAESESSGMKFKVVSFKRK